MNESVVEALMVCGDIPDVLFDRPPWMRHAACRGHDPATFVPPKPMAGAGRPRRLAEVCAGCPVAPECLQYALERPELLGVWGGTTEAQRTVLRRSLAA